MRTPIRFLHTSDWQLGMTRHFLDEDAQARFSEARVNAIRALARIAEREACDFCVVAGDVFETNLVGRRTVARACDALRAFTVPVYLLPGNHDALDASSLLTSQVFREDAPEHVHVLVDRAPVTVVPGVELVGVPWTSRRPVSDLVSDALRDLSPAATGVRRVLVAHGSVDSMNPNRDDPAAISLDVCESALDDGRVHYVALGDHHSALAVGGTGRVRYSGAPEPTRFDEQRPGHALVVTLGEPVRVEEHAVGGWRFVAAAYDLNSCADLDHLARELGELPDRDRTILKLTLRGTLTLTQKARLDQMIDAARAVFASVEEWERHTDLAVVPDDADFADLDLSGFAQVAAAELTGRARDGDAVAGDALALLVRLAGRHA